MKKRNRNWQLLGCAAAGVILLFSRRTVCASASCAEEKGVIISGTRLYAAADYEADDLGEIGPGTEVDILSVLSEFVLIKKDGKYAYIPRRTLSIDDDYEKHYGEKKPCFSPHPVLVTEGNLFADSVEMLLRAYRMIPEKIRAAFENGGFLIKMTEWDVAEEAYEPYGGYLGIGRIKAVTDYERKMIYVNDEWPNAVIHEMGHYVNDALGMYSSRPENRKLFRKEAGKISLYAQSNDREYFAEAFRLYITEPVLLQMISPESFAMVERAASSIASVHGRC